ncbi:DAK2 domain-containing protein [Cellulomonas sp. URHE0023]|uniref:DAK2 domain-containing protein n=1 Tax=Cellulomonas sp. URHE0023 TaxID=1380354 RepID=UPI001E2AB30F|nr:DAK2 domain-containing protein [Cellulomonas sp. URHE0023]
MERLEAGVVRAWAHASHAALAGTRERIDAVNVFPVPDADTGTNVLLTVAGGVEALDAEPAVAGEGVQDVARVFARGAMRSARGNSGVIVSQYLTGFAHALPAHPDGADVARSLRAAARAARGAMQEPQEGTVLTLADTVARSAATAADAGADLETMLGSVVADARMALVEISAEHPVLRAARVLDAGACALLVVLDALARVVAGEEPAEGDSLAWLPSPPTHPWPEEPAGGAFEVMLLVSSVGVDLDVPLHTAMAALGDSVAVVGGEGTWHVHVHTDDPAAAIAAAGVGRREQVLVRLVAAAHASSVQADADRCGVVVCTRSPELAAWYASAGAVTVVRCPEVPISVRHLQRAVTDTGASRVAVLPGDAVGDDELAGLVATHPHVEPLDARDELRVAVAALALATAADAGPAAAQQALGRLRSVQLDAPATALAVRDAVDLLLVSASGPVESLTVLVRDPGQALDGLTDYLAEHHPGVEPTVVGPTGRGPAVQIGLD